MAGGNNPAAAGKEPLLSEVGTQDYS